MNKENFENRQEERWKNRRGFSDKGRIWVGVFFLVVGGLFLARQSGVPLPSWFFTWPMILIGLGILSGIRHRFSNIGWLFPVAIGGIFLIDKISPDINLRPYLWPILLIAAGLFIIFRPKKHSCHRGADRDDNLPLPEQSNTHQATGEWEKPMADQKEVLDITAVFGGVKKNVLSKNFRGGEIVAVMGGAEINLSQADFHGRVMIDCFNMFGGTKLIVPPDWEVQSEVVSIFGGVDDKRPPVSQAASDKILYLEGTCLFGGLEIKSY